MLDLGHTFWENALANGIGTVVGGAVLTLVFFLLREKLFGLPKLNGSWVYMLNIEYSSFGPFNKMQVYYHALLNQDGSRIYGEAEKYLELTTNHRLTFIGKDRVRVSINGHVEKRVFGADRVAIIVHELGHERESVAYHELTCVKELGGTVLGGKFRATVANIHGSALWSPHAFGYPVHPVRATLLGRACRRLLLAIVSPFFVREWRRLEPLATKALQEFGRYESQIRSTSLISLLIAGEDRRHLFHNGVDLRGVARAVFRLITFRSMEGASTIDQQFVRALHTDYRRALSRKFKDICLAIRMQGYISKRHIAGCYLMVAYFGDQLVGAIVSGRQLGIDLSSATNAQLAALIARIKYPAPISPSDAQETKLDARQSWLLREAQLPAAPPDSFN